MVPACDTPPPTSPVPPNGELVRSHRLASFYDALTLLERGARREPVRVAVFGDSNLTLDYTSGYLRRALQARFGDGGHGFVALGRPWSHYKHLDVVHDVISGWRSYAITTSPTGDGHYGLGGIAVENQWQGARTFVATATAPSPFGADADVFRVFSLGRRRGGAFSITIDDEPPVRVETRRDAPELIETVVTTSLGPHEVVVTSVSPEVVRLFGVALERSGPGVVVDSFGVGSLNTKTMAKNDPTIVGQMLRARGYDLLIHLTGANDVFTMDAVPAALAKILAVHREALPSASVLLATPAARGLAKPFPRTELVAEQRRELAALHDVALWDQFQAMGGRDAMPRFVEEGLAHTDAIHFTERGGELMGGRLASALLSGYAEHLGRARAAVCPGAGDPRPD